ncbi:MAG: hypothetical protein AUG14_08165 [Candidatus Rokubacteria bacterium 13_1_20CM_2_68_19]|nr:MAG: hypothetical protein AUI04_14440 [Candidatus Rokubacteria bacterium 13_2_20CM_2_64_8]OLC66617.1 MAG: hypothetical protein AUH76_00690 [Candidatus Rokubacteria bacterium 13_1_40CM_4_67_11]OLD31236.1 MAG: hypothetical protein AUI49_06960 [Candidatus Rokubacteria bacterium 13_1_40CM_2_68_13]OLD97144.1 MAG: hypothetical protein AUG80_12335 [Candidatus Rokubacteria bacterium 13_1_20CM_4_68_9]OLE43591.1 MAG: hypothetical protein AUG14_08165 [Candidatus Rokubacteria bacterium 13_1_20CM_2_68_19
MIQPAVLRGRASYERTMEGWTDDADGDALAHTVRLTDADRQIELRAVTTTSPTYEIRHASCRVLGGDVASVGAGIASLCGARMIAGFTRRVAEAVGNGAGAAFVVDAAIEVARLARQVAKLPRDQAERAASGDALDCWELDTTGWIDLPDSCFTYSAAGRSLFGTRPIATPMQPDLYSPRRGQQRVFVRRKVARLTSLDGRLVLFHSMHDNVHGFEITYELDAATGRVLRAEHVTPKLPYMGICSEPQRRINTLVGEIADDGLRKRLGPLIGGASGCAQLYDLTADVLKLLAP